MVRQRGRGELSHYALGERHETPQSQVQKGHGQPWPNCAAGTFACDQGQQQSNLFT